MTNNDLQNIQLKIEFGLRWFHFIIDFDKPTLRGGHC